MSNSSLMSIAEMIDTAFGESDVNIVNFKLIQAVLYLLARQLRILERKVRIEIEIDRGPLKSNLSVTEVKIHATVPKKKRKAIKPTDSGGRVGVETKTEKLSIKSSKSKPSDAYKSQSEKSMSDKTKFSPDKTSSEKTKSSTDKTTSDKTKTSTEMSSSDKTKTSTDKTASEKTKSSTDKTSSDKTKSSTDKTTTSSKKSSSTKETSDITTTSDERNRKNLPCLMDLIEEQREKEIRIIHQRADSREVGDISPTPMASLDSVEKQYEKLLVVERVPVEIKKPSIGKGTPQLSIVTQDQFESLANVVRELQSRFAPIATPEFPDNMQLMQDLRKGASLTDAMAALQLSARLEAAEKTLNQMMQLVTDLALRSGANIEPKAKAFAETNVLHEATEYSTPLQSRASKKSVVPKQSKHTSKMEMQPLALETVHVSMPSSGPSKIDIVPTSTSVPGPEEEKFDIPPDFITYDDLNKALEEVTDGLLKTITGVTSRSNANAENAIKSVKKLGEKLESSLNLGNRMNDLELLVSEYSEQITILDTGLSSQMTNYQEQLTQMQHDLEAGLESMAEALANTGGDTAAVAELNTNFTNLQTDFDNANSRQRELKECQNQLSQDLEELWKQIEMLRETKPDRDEVADALRDKAGLGALNGLVSLQQFNAVRGDFEKRIGAAYDKFNNQEITWQKAIDDLLRELNDKADWDQLVALRSDVNKNLEMLRNKLQTMLEIVGEPRAAAISKKIFRDAACLSCSTPAHMSLEEPNMIPDFPAFPNPSARPSTIGAENFTKPAEDGDHTICYPGLPIPHPRDPRSHVCQRYCGGSHTLVTDKKCRTPVGIVISPALRRCTTGIGSDGKTYMIEEDVHLKKPCVPCNEKKLNTPQPSEAEPAPAHEDLDSGMTPIDFFSPLCATADAINEPATPPPPTEDF